MQKRKLFFIFFLLLSSQIKADNNVQAVVLAGGGSTRFGTTYSKLTVPICGRPTILYSVLALKTLEVPITVVVGYQKKAIKQIIKDAGIYVDYTLQHEQLGTGHALLCSRDNWFADHVLVINGDDPLVTKENIQELIKRHLSHSNAVTFVTTHNTDPEGAFGRVVVDDTGFMQIVEDKHFTAKKEDYPIVNVGLYLIKRTFLEQYLERIEQNEQTGEFYVTDLIALASKNRLGVGTYQLPFYHCLNTQKQLSHVEEIIKNQLILYWMKRGVRFILPDTIYIDHDVTIGNDSIIHPGVQVVNGTSIGNNCIIEPFSILDSARINNNVTIKAYSHLI